MNLNIKQVLCLVLQEVQYFFKNTTKVIGIHKQSHKNVNINYGDFIFPIIDKLKTTSNNDNKKTKNKTKKLYNKNKIINNNDNIGNDNRIDNENKIINIDNNKKNKNEINMKIKIEKDDINKEIYFLDNTDGDYWIKDKFVK